MDDLVQICTKGWLRVRENGWSSSVYALQLSSCTTRNRKEQEKVEAINLRTKRLWQGRKSTIIHRGTYRVSQLSTFRSFWSN